ncbi:MAG: hypothetical protein KC897_04175 [Candidatus Omnitrophica bacterium]|nr:hypothetical protein [Candidatus Omnitrophota bacterium]MCB9721883.1 hypothetical protein [Candidatus Omnitrophota bacterium]
MESLGYFVLLCSMIPGLFFYVWPVTIGLVVLSLISFVLWLKSHRNAKLNWRWIGRSASVPLIILIYGTCCRADSARQPQPFSEVAANVLFFLLVAQVVAAVIGIRKTPGGGILLSISILIWIFCISVAAALIAGMSITGQWL